MKVAFSMIYLLRYVNGMFNFADSCLTTHCQKTGTRSANA